MLSPCYLHCSKSLFPLSETKSGARAGGGDCHPLHLTSLSPHLFLFCLGTRQEAFVCFLFPVSSLPFATEHSTKLSLAAFLLWAKKYLCTMGELCEMGLSSPWYFNGGNEVIWTVLSLALSAVVLLHGYLLHNSILNISSWIWPLYFLYFSSNNLFSPSS